MIYRCCCPCSRQTKPANWLGFEWLHDEWSGVFGGCCLIPPAGLPAQVLLGTLAKSVEDNVKSELPDEIFTRTQITTLAEGLVTNFVTNSTTTAPPSPRH